MIHILPGKFGATQVDAFAFLLQKTIGAGQLAVDLTCDLARRLLHAPNEVAVIGSYGSLKSRAAAVVVAPRADDLIGTPPAAGRIHRQCMLLVLRHGYQYPVIRGRHRHNARTWRV